MPKISGAANLWSARRAQVGRAAKCETPKRSITILGAEKLIALVMSERPTCHEASSNIAAVQYAVRIGISDSPPIMYLDRSSRKFTGFAVEVLLRSLEEEKIRADIRVLQFASLLPTLNANELDMVIISPSPERDKFAAFSRPFTRYGETLVVPNSDPTAYRTISELRGMRVGSTASGGWADQATQAGAVIVPHKTVTDALCALRDGDLDAVLGNRPSYEHLLKGGSFPYLHMVPSYEPVLVNELSIACRRGDDTHLTLIDKALARFMQDPDYGAIAKAWGFTELTD